MHIYTTYPRSNCHKSEIITRQLILVQHSDTFWANGFPLPNLMLFLKISHRRWFFSVSFLRPFKGSTFFFYFLVVSCLFPPPDLLQCRHRFFFFFDDNENRFSFMSADKDRWRKEAKIQTEGKSLRRLLWRKIVFSWVKNNKNDYLMKIENVWMCTRSILSNISSFIYIYI